MAIEAAHLQKKYNRTYLRSRLICGLRKDNLYKIQFYIKSIHPVLDSVGLFFTANDPLYGKTMMQEVSPAAYLKGNVQSNAFGDSAWRKVDITYKATGEEIYLLVGYFAKNDYRGERREQMENRFFIFLDDFSMHPMDPNEHICTNWRDAADEIYSGNERHELVDRKMRYYRNVPPPKPALERNSMTVIDTLVLPDILFETGKAVLQSSGFAVLDSIISSTTGKQIDSLILKGHTDNTGSFAANEVLSQNRAKSVADYVAPRISKMPVPVFIYGMADRAPLADNNTPAGRRKNRRVEVLVYLRE
jgi:outer membrane protein OmpA-like peptidoglycan-associated protein